MVTKDDVMSVLEKVYDPELGLSVVDLGFIYDVKVEDDRVSIKMTVTVPTCPLRALIAKDVERAVKSIEGVKEVDVEIVFDPPWSPEMMSDKAKKMFGMG
ncbi:MAG: aromatic ring hydroxylase [Thermoplasmata archaeon]|nr:MAG: aromatic ring hydroxylase [Thermoplasmata archaeon]